MNRRLLHRALGWLLPWLLLAWAAYVVAGRVRQPQAVLHMWRPWGEIGALAAALTAIMLTGGIDLSVGAIVALASVVFGTAWQSLGWPPAVAGLAAVATGMLAGAANAALVVWGISPLVATLVTMAVYGGLALSISGGERVAGLPAEFNAWGQGNLLGLPTQLWFFLIVWLAAYLAVHHSRAGRYWYAIGDNRRAARFAAVPVRRAEAALYLASGLVAGLVAVLHAAQSGAVVPAAGQGFELQAIACVVIGGTRVSGGAGGLGRTLLGVAVMSLLDIALQFSRWTGTAHSRMLAVGLLLVGVAIWNERLARAREERSAA